MSMSAWSHASSALLFSSLARYLEILQSESRNESRNESSKPLVSEARTIVRPPFALAFGHFSVLGLQSSVFGPQRLTSFQSRIGNCARETTNPSSDPPDPQSAPPEAEELDGGHAGHAYQLVRTRAQQDHTILEADLGSGLLRSTLILLQLLYDHVGVLQLSLVAVDLAAHVPDRHLVLRFEDSDLPLLLRHVLVHLALEDLVVGLQAKLRLGRGAFKALAVLLQRRDLPSLVEDPLLQHTSIAQESRNLRLEGAIKLAERLAPRRFLLDLGDQFILDGLEALQRHALVVHEAGVPLALVVEELLEAFAVALELFLLAFQSLFGQAQARL
eukprot:scaffold954_cov221-Pinguiococcus_pyrenoidosus.AAC.5